jgi:hypothetical protein
MPIDGAIILTYAGGAYYYQERSVAESEDNDPIRQVIIERTTELGLTPYAVGKMVDGQIGKSTIKAYYAGSLDMTGAKLAILLEALSLKISPKKLPKKS